jgi:hypothetical protein
MTETFVSVVVNLSRATSDNFRPDQREPLS